jgi:hypothetical protein
MEDYADYLLRQDSLGFREELNIANEGLSNADTDLDIDAMLQDIDGSIDKGGLVGANRRKNTSYSKTSGRYLQKSPVSSLMVAWMNEEASPDILPFEDSLVSTISHKLGFQVEEMFPSIYNCRNLP